MFNYIFAAVCILVPAVKLCFGQGCIGNATNECIAAVNVSVEEIVSQQISKEELPNEDFLNQYCDDGIVLADCMYNYTLQCEDPFEQQFTGFLKNISKQICNKTSDFRKTYIKNLPCANKNVKDIEQCVVATWGFTVSQYPYDENSPENNQEMWCLLIYMQKTVCIQGIIENNCGTEAGNFVNEILKDVQMPGVAVCSKDMLEKVLEENDERINKYQWKKK